MERQEAAPSIEASRRRSPWRIAWVAGLLLAMPFSQAPVRAQVVSAQLFATVAPSPFLPVRGSAEVTARLTTASGSPVPLSRVRVRLAGARSGVGLTQPTPAQRRNGVVAVLRAGGAAASAAITVSAPGATSEVLPVRVYSNPTQLVAGKGAWASFHTYSALGAQTILQRSAQEGVTHLYLETTGLRFVGQSQMNSIVEQAHNLGIAVIAWDYASLQDVPMEIGAADTTLSYTTAHGAQVDGLGADFEGNLSAGAMQGFSSAVRQALGPDRVYVGIIYPPQSGFDTPIATMAHYVNVFAPMDYWLTAPRPYTAAEAASFVTESIQGIENMRGEAHVPIEVISQTQDVENVSGFGSGNPPAAQVVASARAAMADGAIGVSFYDLRTQTAPQMAAIAGLSLPPRTH